MNDRTKRIAALEKAHPSSVPRWYCLRRYENESDEQARTAYEAEHGPIGESNSIIRVIINKPGLRFEQVPASI